MPPLYPVQTLADDWFPGLPGFSNCNLHAFLLGMTIDNDEWIQILLTLLYWLVASGHGC